MLPIISAEERLKERHSAKVALVGPPGVGKTSQLRTLPADTTLFVDLEAGDNKFAGIAREEPPQDGAHLV